MCIDQLRNVKFLTCTKCLESCVTGINTEARTFVCARCVVAGMELDTNLPCTDCELEPAC